MIARHVDEFPVRLMCRVLAVSVSGSSAYRRRPERWRAVIDDVLMAHVRIAFAESFFATLKRELVDRVHWRIRDEARAVIFTYIESWYNRQRRHSS